MSSLRRWSALSSWPAGARSIVISAFWLSLMGVFVKLAGQRLPSHEMVFARSLATFVLSAYALRMSGAASWGRRKPMLALRGVCGFLAMLCIYYSVTKLPLAEATVIQYCHPVLTTLVAWWWLDERPPRSLWLAIALSFGGVLLVAQPSWLFGDGAVNLDSFAVLIAFVGAVLSAGSYVLVRNLSRTEDTHVIIFYFPLIALPASVPLLLVDAVWPVGIEWLWLIGLGIATQLGQVYLTRGLREQDAGRAGSFSYVQVAFAALWGVLFFDAVPSAMSWLGAGLIFTGSLLSARQVTDNGVAKVASAPEAR